MKRRRGFGAAGDGSLSAQIRGMKPGITYPPDTIAAGFLCLPVSHIHHEVIQVPDHRLPRSMENVMQIIYFNSKVMDSIINHGSEANFLDFDPDGVCNRVSEEQRLCAGGRIGAMVRIADTGLCPTITQARVRAVLNESGYRIFHRDGNGARSRYWIDRVRRLPAQARTTTPKR